MSPSLIQTRRFILPRIRQSRSLPSWHLTRIRSKPSSFTTTPKTSPCAGYTSSLISPSLNTFFLPKRSPHGFSLKKNWLASLKACLFQHARLKGLSGKIECFCKKHHNGRLTKLKFSRRNICVCRSKELIKCRMFSTSQSAITLN